MVAIKGMNMPENCSECSFKANDYVCGLLDCAFSCNHFTERNYNCPLVEVVTCKTPTQTDTGTGTIVGATPEELQFEAEEAEKGKRKKMIREEVPFEDAVSRQAVLDIVKFEENWLFDAKSNNADTNIAFSSIRAQVAKLSPVTSMQKWIPCSERTPEKSGVYIVTEKEYSVDDRKHTGRFNLMTKQVEFYDGKWKRASFYEVIAWMPLPEPYKVES